jgi:hypothetical protein
MTQKERLKKHLMQGHTISRLEGWDRLGIIELPARICELKADGYDIITQYEKVRNRYGEAVQVARWMMAREELEQEPLRSIDEDAHHHNW